MLEEPLLTTQDVATLLGVKPATVYAYVSRGLLVGRRNGSGKQSLFAKSDVDAFLAGRRRATTPEIQTGITLIKDGNLYYRSHHVPTLARTVSFEAVAELLWTGELDNAGPAGDDTLLELAGAVTAPLPDAARLTDRLRVIVAAAAAGDPLRFDTSPTAVVATGRQLIATMIRALPARVGGPLPLTAPLAEHLWLRLTADPPSEAGLRALNAALVLLADHDLAASTLAARIAASTRAHPYAVVSAGLAVLDGPLHGAASSLAYAMLKQAHSSSDPLAAVSAGLRAGGPVAGFGHPLYPDGDPRATALFALIEDGPVRRTAYELDRALRDRSGNAANIDLALAALALHHHMPADAGEAIFAVARTAGWLAHALEEYSERPSRFRPRSRLRDPARDG